jgi:type IV pilus assembly protein PilA
MAKIMARIKKGQRGFTLIELLIVVAILGVLAAVVIPNVGRFLGTGEAAAKDTELHNLQSAVVAMMTDNNISALPNPVTAGTGAMDAFPDATTTAAAKGLDAGDGDGYLLFSHDMTAGGSVADGFLENYLTFNVTSYCYTVLGDGTVTQLATKWDGTICS